MAVWRRRACGFMLPQANGSALADAWALCLFVAFRS
jgi:hypothetical protein